MVFHLTWSEECDNRLSSVWRNVPAPAPVSNSDDFSSLAKIGGGGGEIWWLILRLHSFFFFFF